MTDIYAAIGPTEPDDAIRTAATAFAADAAITGLSMRCVGAGGSRAVFERGVRAVGGEHVAQFPTSSAQGLEYASRYTPGWDVLDSESKCVAAGHVLVLLGSFLDRPARFVVGWDFPPLIIMVAALNGIPLYDLSRGEMSPL